MTAAKNLMNAVVETVKTSYIASSAVSTNASIVEPRPSEKRITSPERTVDQYNFRPPRITSLQWTK